MEDDVPSHHLDVVDDVQTSSAERQSESTDDSSVAAPDGGYGWVIIIAAFAINFIHDGLLYSFGVFYVEWLDYFGDDRTRTSLIGSASGALAQVTALLTGVLVNRFGCSRVTFAGSVIATFGLAISRLAGSINTLIFTFGIIVGFGFGLMFLPSVVAVSEYFEKRRALATGIAMCGAGIGSFVMAPVGSVLFQLLDWKNAMFVFAAITLQGCVFGSLLRPLAADSRNSATRSAKSSTDGLPATPNTSSDASSDENEIRPSVSENNSSISPQTEGKQVKKPLLSRIVRTSGLYLLANPIFLCMFIGNLLTALGFLIPFYFIADRAIMLGVERTQAAFLLSAIGITNTAGRILMGFLADLKHVSPLLLHNVALLTAGVAGLLVRFCVVYWAMIVYALVHGLCLATFGTLTSVVLCDLVGLESLSNSFGMLCLVRGLAGAAGPPLAVAVASSFDESNIYDTSFAIAGAEFVIGAAIFCLVPVLLRRRRRTVVISPP